MTSGTDPGDQAPIAPALDVEDLLRQVPFFRTLARLNLARLIGALEEVSFAAGTRIFAEGAEGDALYLLKRGRVAITVTAVEGERSVATLEAPAHFGDLGLLLAHRTASAGALTDVEAWVLPRRRFERLVHDRPTLGLEIAASIAGLLDQRSRERTGAPPAPPDMMRAVPATAGPRRRSRTHRIAAIAVPVGFPLVLWWLRPPGGLTDQGWHTGLIVLGPRQRGCLTPRPTSSSL